MVRVDVQGRVTRFRGPSALWFIVVVIVMVTQGACALIPLKALVVYPLETLIAFMAFAGVFRSLTYEVHVSPAGMFNHVCLFGFTVARFSREQSPDPLTLLEDEDPFEPLPMSRDPHVLVAQAARRAHVPSADLGAYR